MSHNLEACKDQVDFPKTVRFVFPGDIILMTNEGHLQYFDGSSHRWRTLTKDKRFHSYSVIETTRRTSLVVIGSVCGLIKLISLDGSTEFEEQLFDGKVLSLSLLEQEDDEKKVHLLANGPDGILIFQQLVLSQKSWSTANTRKFYLPPKKQCWLTTACLLDNVSLLICGDRGGTLHVYDLQSSKSSPEAVPATQSFHRIHSKAGLTHICYHDNSVYTCGRDGYYRMFQVTSSRLHMLQSNRVMKGLDWLTRFIKLGDSLLIIGFYMEQLLVYNLSQSELLVAIPCGGGHRAWDFVLNNDPGSSETMQNRSQPLDGSSGQFVYIKRKDVVLCDVELSSRCNVLKGSFCVKSPNGLNPTVSDFYETWTNCSFFSPENVRVINATVPKRSQSEVCGKTEEVKFHTLRSGIKTWDIKSICSRHEQEKFNIAEKVL
ncbi:hypothetical protein LSH36_452g01002 [Paralvinella palmiformis]|uniref:Uncharacterized protein n=1 Tax=Paralvinella palmiformis TaxID=53620 RepID=A0AAD9JA61_9ANNE|nr:hypothetical protein LSH36_452g01002 [Paralvinella palmiformis]